MENAGARLVGPSVAFPPPPLPTQQWDSFATPPSTPQQPPSHCPEKGSPSLIDLLLFLQQQAPPLPTPLPGLKLPGLHKPGGRGGIGGETLVGGAGSQIIPQVSWPHQTQTLPGVLRVSQPHVWTGNTNR